MVVKRASTLALRGLKSPSIHFQAGNIALMLFQSFVAPFIIGVAAFGAQMLFVAPVFFAQALLEPSYQAELNANQVDGRCRINLSSILLPTTIFMVIAIVMTIGEFSLPLLVVLALFYPFYTLVIAAAFALKDVKLAAFGRYLSLTVYICAFAASVALGFDGAIIIANTAGFTVASLIIGAILFARGSIALRWERPNFGALIGGLSFRLPTVCVTGFTTIVLGYAGATAATIGEFRILMAAINAGRFANVVPLARLQAAIQHFAMNRDRDLPGLLRHYLVSFAVFCVVLVALFPLAYDWVYGQPNFGRLPLFVASFFVLAQPLAYAILAFKPNSAFFNLAFPAGLSAAAMAAFYGVFSLSRSADLAVSVSVVLLMLIYVPVARNVSKGITTP